MVNKTNKEAIENLLQRRYYQNDEKNWSDLSWRVAKNIASCEENSKYWTKQYYEILNSKDFISSTPSLINADMVAQQLSSCFIIKIEDDSLEAIFKAVTEAGKIFQKNGGKKLPPFNSNVKAKKLVNSVKA